MLNPDSIVDLVRDKAGQKTVWLAFSGGVDSHVLLHLLASASNQATFPLHAIHIDHGLQSNSSQWSEHCEQVAKQLNIPFVSISVTVENIDSIGLEAAAREARYTALEQYLTENDLLLTAQHQEDQAETLLLQLLRGAGPKGLSAMATEFQLNNVDVFRPLIGQSQADILAYAHQHELNWIEDPSNADTRWSRNYLRHSVWPVISERWPSAARTLSRSAEHCAEASELLDDLAKQDFDALTKMSSDNILPIDELLALSKARRNNLLRFFISLKQLPMPSSTNLQRVVDEVCLAMTDSTPLVSWAGVEVRRYQNQLYFMKPLAEHDANKTIEINDFEDIQLSENCIVHWQKSAIKGIDSSMLGQDLTLRFRQGGESIMPQGNQHHKSLKHLFQEWGVPPWLRSRVPLIFLKDELVVVTEYCHSDFACANNDRQVYLPVIKMVD